MARVEMASVDAGMPALRLYCRMSDAREMHCSLLSPETQDEGKDRTVSFSAMFAEHGPLNCLPCGLT